MKVTNLIVSITTTALLGIGFTTFLPINYSKALGIKNDACAQNGFEPHIRAETRNYYIYICSRQGGEGVYFGQPKDQSDGIGPIYGSFEKSNDTGRWRWVFPNGNYSYSVNDKYLVVTKNDEVILREKILSYDDINE